MKVVIISDIHGNYDDFNYVINNESFDKIVVLGDLLGYGFFEDDEILKVLQKIKNKLVLVQGNCDRYIDYEKYDLYAHDVISLTMNNHVVTFTHGHIYSKGFLPDYHGDIFIQGHTHIPELTKERGIIYANPGSLGIPRGLSKKGYLIFDDNKLILKTVNNEIIKEMIV